MLNSGIKTSTNSFNFFILPTLQPSEFSITKTNLAFLEFPESGHQQNHGEENWEEEEAGSDGNHFGSSVEFR